MSRMYEERFAILQRKRMSKAAKGLRTFTLLSTFVVLMSWLAVEVVPRLWWAFKMWGN